YEDYSKALEINPRLAPVYNNRGNIRQMRGDLDGAITDYTRTIALDPRFGRAYVSRASTRHLKGEVDGALADLNEAVKGSKLNTAGVFRLDARNLDLAVAYHQRGLVFLARKDFAKALADFDRAIEINRHFPEAHINRGLVRSALGHLNDALTDYDCAIALDPNLAEAYNQRGVV